MNDTELDSFLNELAEPPLPMGLRTRTLAGFSGDVRRRRFLWQAVLCAVLLCAATVGAYERPAGWPRSWDTYPLQDGNRLVVRTVFNPKVWSGRLIMTLFLFRIKGEMREGRYQQVFSIRGTDTHSGYSLQPRSIASDTYELAFSGAAEPPTGPLLGLASRATVKLDQPFAIRWPRTFYYTCLSISRTGDKSPECGEPPMVP